MSERETRDVVLPCGKVASIVTFLTGRDVREISRAPLQSIRVQQNMGHGIEPMLGNVNLAQCGKDEEEVLLKCAVLKLDGSSENVFERLLDLPATDWEVVIEEAKKLQAPTKE